MNEVEVYPVRYSYPVHTFYLENDKLLEVLLW